MPTFPNLWGAQRWASIGVSGANGTAPTSTVNNTKGNWSQLTASAPFDVAGIIVSLGPGGGSADFLFDIGIGAAASEVVLIADLLFSNVDTAIGQAFFPVQIPAGTRIAARKQSTAFGTNAYISCQLVAASATDQPASRAITYGANTADSGGTSVDPGGSSGTKGSYSQVTAATTGPIRKLIVCIGNQVNTARTGANWKVDIAVGAGGSEVVVIPDISLTGSAGDDSIKPGMMEYDITIPAGSRLAVRAACSITDATDRLFDVVLVGVG